MISFNFLGNIIIILNFFLFQILKILKINYVIISKNFEIFLSKRDINKKFFFYFKFYEIY